MTLSTTDTERICSLDWPTSAFSALEVLALYKSTYLLTYVLSTDDTMDCTHRSI